MTVVSVPDPAPPPTPPVVVQAGDSGGAVVAQALEHVQEEAKGATEAAGAVHTEVQQHAATDEAEHLGLAAALASVAERLDTIDRRWAEWQTSQTAEASSAVAGPVEVAVPGVNPEATPPAQQAEAVAETTPTAPEGQRQQERKPRYLIRHPMRR